MSSLTFSVFSGWICAVAFLLFASSSVSALQCFQGQQNSTLPVSGSVTQCPLGSMSCTKSVEPALKIATRGCQQTNCSLNGIISSEGVCQNSTSYPYATYCCCYGDGCNSATRFFSSFTQLLSVTFFVTVALCIHQLNFVN
uniref:UPAR/Ly6 domain-containing protein n=1 Tax=Ditylenchus dipsaci TaxID=166011 RepID=A0A915CN24_9BILA